jgi:hypothetical protein
LRAAAQKPGSGLPSWVPGQWWRSRGRPDVVAGGNGWTVSGSKAQGGVVSVGVLGRLGGDRWGGGPVRFAGAYLTLSGKRLPRCVGVVRGGCACVTVRVGPVGRGVTGVLVGWVLSRRETAVPGGSGARLAGFGAADVMLTPAVQKGVSGQPNRTRRAHPGPKDGSAGPCRTVMNCGQSFQRLRNSCVLPWSWWWVSRVELVRSRRDAKRP